MKKSKWYVVIGASVIVLVTILCCAVWYNADKFVLETREPAMQASLFPERIARGNARQNITYCGNQKLDFYTPTVNSYQKAPLILYVHGGGWHMNNKDSDSNMRNLFDGLRAKGYALVSIDYSLTPQNQYPKPQQDALCAVRFMRANVNRFSIDTQKFVITGFSAGANLAALVGSNNLGGSFNNGLYKTVDPSVQAVIGIGGVYDFTANLRPNSIGNIRNLMQDSKLLEGSPTTYVSGKNAPTLLIFGSKDSVVYPSQSTNFADLLTKNDVVNSVVEVKNAEHDLSDVGSAASPTKEELSSQIELFLSQQLGL